MTFAPIALFIYRRADHTRRLLRSLAACPELADSPLYIFCDGPKSPDGLASVEEARRAAREAAPAHAVFVEREHNLGLSRSIIQGVGELCDRFGRIIVLEDDLEVAPSFLRFMNRALEKYATEERVFGVSGYQFPLGPPPSEDTMFLHFPSAWGWATWQRAWKHFDPTASGYAALKRDKARRHRFDFDGAHPYFKMLQAQLDGKIDSWAIRWYLSVFEQNGLVLYPGKSLIRNLGFDSSGTHCGPESGFAGSPFAPELSSMEWQMPASLRLHEAVQARIGAFLAAQRASQRTERLQALATKWVRKAVPDSQMAKLQSIPFARRLVDKVLGSPEGGANAAPDRQDLEVYWDPKMAELLETWGIGNAWNEIQLLLVNARGSVLDIACGTGKVMSLLAAYPSLEVHGFDISDFLLQKAIDRGIPRERLKVADATATDYPNDAFEYGYSIGSLEHFTEQGILDFVAETHRIIRKTSFHQIPVSRNGKNHGWVKSLQSYHNNSVEWWLERYRSAYSTVYVFDSAWSDKISVGKWFVCVKAQP
jgi:SAM-dependent methyltransferase